MGRSVDGPRGNATQRYTRDGHWLNIFDMATPKPPNSTFLCSQAGSQFAENIAIEIYKVHFLNGTGRTGWSVDEPSENAMQRYTTETATG